MKTFQLDTAVALRAAAIRKNTARAVRRRNVTEKREKGGRSELVNFQNVRSNQLQRSCVCI